MCQKYLTIVLLMVSLVVVSCKNSHIGNTGKDQTLSLSDTSNAYLSGSIISFRSTDYDAGTVDEGTNLTHEFTFFNKGDEPLIITKVRPTCNCTVASYPKTPILPEKSEKIKVELDTKHLGKFVKKVAVYSNAINNVDDQISSSRIILNIRWSVVSNSK